MTDTNWTINKKLSKSMRYTNSCELNQNKLRSIYFRIFFCENRKKENSTINKFSSFCDITGKLFGFTIKIETSANAWNEIAKFHR